MRKYEHKNNKFKHGTFKKSKIKRGTENSANTEGGKMQSPKKGREPRRRVLTLLKDSSGDGDKTSRERDWQRKTEEKDQFNQQ